MTEPVHCRVGRSQSRNLYRHIGDDPDGVYIGVCFDPADTALVVEALNERDRLGRQHQALLNLCANAKGNRPAHPPRADLPAAHHRPRRRDMTRIELHENGHWKDITGQASDVEIRWGRMSEHGPVQPRMAHVTLNNSASLFATDLAAWKGAHRIESMLAVMVEVPDGPWQRLKFRLRRVRGLGWLPVRMRWETRFRGVVEPNPFGWVKP